MRNYAEPGEENNRQQIGKTVKKLRKKIMCNRNDTKKEGFLHPLPLQMSAGVCYNTLWKKAYTE